MNASTKAPALTRSERLTLRPVRVGDETALRAATAALAPEQFVFAFGLEDAGSFESYVASLEDRRNGHNLSPGWVPETYLLAEVAGTIVGRLSLRHELNEALRKHGGHIGFGVLLEHRKRGYATEMLRQGLEVARCLGLDRVLLTCDETNQGSQRVIERHGGVYSGSTTPAGSEPATRHYWIALTGSRTTSHRST